MRDHRRILGALFIGWAVVQVATGVSMAIAGTVELTATFWLVLAAIAGIYAWVGVQLRRGVQLRLAAGVLSILALPSIPIGTLLGVYGLWVVIRAPGWQTRRRAEGEKPTGAGGEHERPV